ncbi:hypothetical protein SNE40_015059 [Patella caerulea]|uniref:Uncharacterized protein n=1 Tax=Patella caerulea TaxID=87958 RepID=A0AAN8PK40_PATCE
MRALIACTLLALACAQFKLPFWNGLHSDRHDGYIFEYHSRHNLFLVRDRSHCYLVDAPDAWDAVVADKAKRNQIEDEIVKMIHDNQGTHKESGLQALSLFHDPLEAAECIRKTVYTLDYKYQPAN